MANKHRLQMLDHFSECIKHTKSGRQEAIQMNVFTAVLSGLKGLNEAKTGFGQEDVKKSATNLIIVRIYDMPLLSVDTKLNTIQCYCTHYRVL